MFKKILPSFTIQLHLQFSTRHLLTSMGSQSWKGVRKAGTEERGYGSWEHWPRPHPGLSTFQACILDLKGRLTLGLWTTMAAMWSLQSGGERPEHFSGGNSPGRRCLAMGILPSGPWAHVPHTPPHPQPQDNACPAYPISGNQRLPEL